MLAPGFVDPVHDAQETFRAVLDALSRPGLPWALSTRLVPPEPLTPELAALALTLADSDTPLWLDAALSASSEVADYLRFHAGAPIAGDPSEAAFALVRDPLRCPPLSAFASGTPAYPDASTTLVVALDRIEAGAGEGGVGLRLTGPGIRGTGRLALAPMPADWPAQMAANHARFPLGIDLILTASGVVAGLPRSTAIAEG